jgi:hypothetical protein
VSDFQLVIAAQLADLLVVLRDGLDQHDGDPARTALDPELAPLWRDVEPETRSALMLAAAYMAGSSPAPTVPDDMHPQVAPYVEDFHKYAAAFAPDQSEAFHGRHFPAMPLPGQAGALASSLGFDRDDLAISLGVALVLLAAAAGRKADQ